MLALGAVALAIGLGAGANALFSATEPRSRKPSGRQLIARRHRPLVRVAHRRAELEDTAAAGAETVLAKSVPLAALGATSAVAGLFIPALALPSVLVTGYLTVPFLVEGWQKYRRNRHIIDLADGAIIPLLVLLGQYLAASLIPLVISISRRVLAGTYDRSRQRLISVFGDLPKRVWVVHGESEIEVDYREVKPGDIVVINPGEVIPVDGVIVAGDGLVDQHMLTGESVPAEKTLGDRMFATTMVVSGRFRVRVERSGGATHASEITQLILQAADRRLRVQERGEAIGERSLPFMVALAATAGMVGGMVRGIAVYLVTPGYTMRLLAPLALLRGLRRAADDGVLIKDGRSLELLRDVDTVVFDKTGTLTDGSLRVAHVVPADGFDQATVLAMAAAAEGRQSHPIAHALRAAATDAPLPAAVLDDSELTVGRGVRAQVAGRPVLVGSPAFLTEQRVAVPEDVRPIIAQLGACGMTAILVGIDGKVAGVVALDQVVRPEAAETIARLRERGMETVIISGDGDAATRHLAELCGVDGYHAETMPGDKARLIEEMQQAGRKVCYIGDGINDAGALKQANVSISIRGATSIAVDTAQVVLLTPNLSLVNSLLDVSDRYESATEFAARLAIWVPSAILPLVFFGYGGVILALAGHQTALWTGLVRILNSNKMPTTTSARPPSGTGA